MLCKISSCWQYKTNEVAKTPARAKCFSPTALPLLRKHPALRYALLFLVEV